jgi:uncharacterized protein (TIGR04552 family)
VSTIPQDDAAAVAEAYSRLASFSLQDLEAVRLLLRGGSVIDWHKLAFENLEEVDRFLRVSELDPGRPSDLERLEDIRTEAVEFIARNFSFRIPEEIAYDTPARELFLVASKKGRRQTYACIILKLMHVLHHLHGRELLFKLPISDHEVFHLVEEKVVRVVDEIRAAGHPITEFAWSRKERDSMILKLLAKKDNIAAQLYDKLRFRLQLRYAIDMMPLLRELQQRLLPFNYVIPGESVNEILQFRQLVESEPLAHHAQGLQAGVDLEENERIAKGSRNEFSGPGYKSVSFVADLPLRIDSFLSSADGLEEEYGNIVFVLIEFQLVDQRVANENEIGENSHEAYKQRKLARVKARLTRGLEPLK